MPLKDSDDPGRVVTWSCVFEPDWKIAPSNVGEGGGNPSGRPETKVLPRLPLAGSAESPRSGNP